ncbi:hypothetical protein B0A48_18378 [Cryoendolithus antarcticus]|uniref:Phosphotransferase n=1 Tax=Cryoendolithus antarcticus TaxID=1507870 RepID=A0A1V8S8N3_9PEZI|nr:hypothetical protein B0A48_18378 [Cryoendolithus antarcticus]
MTLTPKTTDEDKRRDSKRDDAHLDGFGPLPVALETELRKLEQAFTVDTAKLKEISLHFENELRKGLSRVSRCLLPSPPSSPHSDESDSEDYFGFQTEEGNLPMNPTWVLGWPSGRETGEYLTLDLGGTKLRICWVTLSDRNNEPIVDQEIYQIPEHYKAGEAEQLWSFLANSIADFVQDRELEPDEGTVLPLGFTFSYPAVQEYIDHGVLHTWTKGWDIKGVEGHDVAGQLRQAIRRKGLPIDIVALMNDTTGAMIASAYHDPETIIGAITGPGCNACYMENCGSISKLDGHSLPANLPMAINCEYGAFDNEHLVLPRTEYDVAIDEESPRPGEQAFEKMSAGMYCSEIFRQIVLDLWTRKLVFKGQSATKLKVPYVLDIDFMFDLEEDFSHKLSKTRMLLRSVLQLDANDAELLFCRHIVEIINTRSTRLSTCGVSAICRKKDIKSGHVAADAVMASRPRLKARWAQALGEVLDWPQDREHDPIIMTVARDGSGVGAAVISAMTLQRIADGDLTGVKQK